MSNYDDASPQIVAFTLGGMAFEYDEEKNQKNIAKHGIPLEMRLAYFLIMTALDFMMKSTAKMRTDMIRLEI